jgi:hypothetical protein
MGKVIVDEVDRRAIAERIAYLNKHHPKKEEQGEKSEERLEKKIRKGTKKLKA